MILQLEQHPQEAVAAIDASGESFKYSDLCTFIKELKTIVPKRSLLFLLTENNVGGIAWSICSISSGSVPLILNAHIDEKLYNNLYELYKPAYLCLPKEQYRNINYEVIMERYDYVLLRTEETATLMHEDLSHLLPTSGSTGSPKLVRHKYENIEAAALNISTFFSLKASDRPLLVLPLYYTMGLSVVFSHLYVGATILITNQRMTDRAFWTFMKERKATSFTGVPYSFEIFNHLHFFRMDLPNLELLTQGGGKMQRELNLKFAEYCKEKGMRWIATYGQSEGTARMAYLPAEYAINKCGSIGQAVPNGELTLIDFKGNTINQPYVEGEMCYQGRNVTMGYARQREDLLLGDERHGYIRTGDLAYRDEDNCYFIVGRMGRFLKLFGMRIGLDECEQIIKAKFPIECACIGTDKKMTIYVTDESKVTVVKEELVEKTRLVASAFEVKVIDIIPKNEAGKTLYAQLQP